MKKFNKAIIILPACIAALVGISFILTKLSPPKPGNDADTAVFKAFDDTIAQLSQRKFNAETPEAWCEAQLELKYIGVGFLREILESSTVSWIDAILSSSTPTSTIFQECVRYVDCLALSGGGRKYCVPSKPIWLDDDQEN